MTKLDKLIKLNNLEKQNRKNRSEGKLKQINKTINKTINKYPHTAKLYLFNSFALGDNLN